MTSASAFRTDPKTVEGRHLVVGNGTVMIGMGERTSPIQREAWPPDS